MAMAWDFFSPRSYARFDFQGDDFEALPRSAFYKLTDPLNTSWTQGALGPQE